MTGATIGDGFYGKRDVDMYRFNATEGQFVTIATSPADGSASTTPSCVSSTAPATSCLWLSTPTPPRPSAISGSGHRTYYVGVSGLYNYTYDPKVAGSGSALNYTGTYNLKMTLVTPTPDNVGDT